MNTNQLKRFAQEARKKLITQIAAKVELVLTSDSAELREKSSQIAKLQEAINAGSRAQVIDKVAYTWFNRFMALRFMDVNQYQPLGLGILTPKKGYTLPELLDEAKQGHIPEDLNVKRQHIYDLLDGKIKSANAQNEAYKELLIGACNHLNTIFPFLFEKINDYTELLLPDDLTSEFSILQDIREGMTAEDCQEVEIIGWLYQFYISELNDELISSKKKYKKEDLAPASQLFTPKWIVQYMVDNTLGQLWSELNPNTKVTDSLEFYIQPASKEQLAPRKQKNIEDIKFFEPCVGSGHILSYAFDVFYKMYEEQGYNPTEIPELIITKNLFGVDIDQRAAQLASFVLLMKGRQKHSRFLRAVEKNGIQPNISFYQDFEFDNKFKNATALGSLITVTPEEAKAYKVEENSLFGERQSAAKKLYDLLGQRYDVVVTNPPYISSSRMEGSLKQYVESNYPETKSDLFATFILRCLELCNNGGFTGYMTPFVWMFVLTYEKLRKQLVDRIFITTLIQLEYSGYDGATVPICTFTIKKIDFNNLKGRYIRLKDFKGAQLQPIKTLEAIKNPQVSWIYNFNQLHFLNIEGCPLAFWVKPSIGALFKEMRSLGEYNPAKSGVMTGNDLLYIRYWWEISFCKIGFNYSSFNDWDFKIHHYFPLNKEEGYQKWSGKSQYVLKLLDNDINFKQNPKLNYRLRDKELYFKSGISYGNVTSSKTSYRFQESGLVFADTSPTIFSSEKHIVGVLNSCVIGYIQEILNPTIHFKIGDLHRIPIPKSTEIPNVITEVVERCILINDLNWVSNDKSYRFLHNELIQIKCQDLEESYDLYKQFWKNKFYQLHKNEEDLNAQFIEIYGLQKELTPDVPLGDITILRDELNQQKVAVLSKKYSSGWGLVDGKWKLDSQQHATQKPDLPFDAKEIFAQFISYAVGCMFGRYSLDAAGLILANQGETLKTYLEKLQKTNSKFQSLEDLSFVPDDDNIIPILDDEWFEDDIVGRFYEFLKVSFGKANFDKNLAFVEECLGKDIRKYFVKDFYSDHIKRYKKRPIYWMFSSPKGSFNVLIYLHRYTPDTLNEILNGYLVEYREKLRTRNEHLDHIIVSGTPVEQTKATKEKDKLKTVLLELQEYERDTLYPSATERIPIDLDDGVLVNYNKFGKAIKEVSGLNDKVTKKKVKGFDWIDVTQIR